MTYYRFLDTPNLGRLLLVANATHLTGIYFADRAHAPAITGDWRNDESLPLLIQTVGELQEFFAGDRTTFSLPLRAPGTPFQQKVWGEIAAIPHGRTITYSELARRVGSADAVRAAGTATGRNPLSIVVPCHRVVGKDGKMTGYAGGVARKEWLLMHETGERQLTET